MANVGPIGCIPYQREFNSAAGYDCLTYANEMAESFNQQLKSLVMELNLAMEDAFFVYADVYHIVSDIIRNYTSYGT